MLDTTHCTDSPQFQYLALIRYGRKTSAAHKRIKEDLGESQQKLQDMQEIASTEQAKVLSLEQEVERLRPLEQELLRFKARLPAIEHYLKLLPRLVEYACSFRRMLAPITADAFQGERINAKPADLCGLPYGFGAHSKSR